MGPLSLRTQLSKISEPASFPLRIPGDFHVARKSLRALLLAMESPRIAEWAPGPPAEFDNFDWGDECQGMVSDGASIFAVSSDPGHHAVYQLAFNFATTAIVDMPLGLGEVGDESFTDKHIGGPGFLHGKMFVPVDITYPGVVLGWAELLGDTLPPLPPPKVWIIDTATLAFEVVELVLPAGLAHFMFGWCAPCPWNGRLYASDDGSAGPVSQILAFERDGDRFVPVKPLVLSRDVFGFQGGAISEGGKLYLSGKGDPSGPFEVLAFSMINGAFLGSHPIAAEDEVESIGLFRIPQLGTQVQVVVLSNDVEDDVFLHGFVVPDPFVL